jgi:hypothetical protein
MVGNGQRRHRAISRSDSGDENVWEVRARACRPGRGRYSTRTTELAPSSSSSPSLSRQGRPGRRLLVLMMRPLRLVPFRLPRSRTCAQQGRVSRAGRGRTACPTGAALAQNRRGSGPPAQAFSASATQPRTTSSALAHCRARDAERRKERPWRPSRMHAAPRGPVRARQARARAARLPAALGGLPLQHGVPARHLAVVHRHRARGQPADDDLHPPRAHRHRRPRSHAGWARPVNKQHRVRRRRKCVGRWHSRAMAP